MPTLSEKTWSNLTTVGDRTEGCLMISSLFHYGMVSLDIRHSCLLYVAVLHVGSVIFGQNKSP
ncbi:MAG: hypothetical protein D6694_12445 [Gammaproteobacteria bacterium]|nr:MAG: hypothetical protein D6694_12445 [Gammaproteobacteria bacterium]